MLKYVQVSGDNLGAVTNVTADHGRVMSGDGIEVFALMQRAKALREKVESEIEVEAARVLAAARTMSIEDIINRGSEQVWPSPVTHIPVKPCGFNASASSEMR